MDISPYYIDARNTITQPDKMVFISQYFRRSWMPILGPLGTAIVIYLRGACYHNRKSGETRDTVQISQREIAAGCGCSVPTLKRELERNLALGQFVQISPEWERDGKNGRVRQLENHYKVAMDDPLTETDEARLKELIEERISQERISQEQQARVGPGERSRKLIRVKEGSSQKEASSQTETQTETGLTACSKAGLHSVRHAVINEGIDAVNTACSNNEDSGDNQTPLTKAAPVAQNELLRPVAHFEPTPVQNELLYNESLLKTTKEKETLNVSEAIHFVTQKPKEAEAPSQIPVRRSVIDDVCLRESAKIVEELKDWGSERRHHQLLSVCEQYGLPHLPGHALKATRQRLAQETKLGVLEKPGAYYQKVLIKLLADHQVFTPTLAEKSVDNPEDVRQLVRLSLGLD